VHTFTRLRRSAFVCSFLPFTLPLRSSFYVRFVWNRLPLPAALPRFYLVRVYTDPRFTLRVSRICFTFTLSLPATYVPAFVRSRRATPLHVFHRFHAFRTPFTHRSFGADLRFTDFYLYVPLPTRSRYLPLLPPPLPRSCVYVSRVPVLHTVCSLFPFLPDSTAFASASFCRTFLVYHVPAAFLVLILVALACRLDYHSAARSTFAGWWIACHTGLPLCRLRSGCAHLPGFTSFAATLFARPAGPSRTRLWLVRFARPNTTRFASYLCLACHTTIPFYLLLPLHGYTPCLRSLRCHCRFLRSSLPVVVRSPAYNFTILPFHRFLRCTVYVHSWADFTVTDSRCLFVDFHRLHHSLPRPMTPHLFYILLFPHYILIVVLHLHSFHSVCSPSHITFLVVVTLSTVTPPYRICSLRICIPYLPFHLLPLLRSTAAAFYRLLPRFGFCSRTFRTFTRWGACHVLPFFRLPLVATVSFLIWMRVALPRNLFSAPLPLQLRSFARLVAFVPCLICPDCTLPLLRCVTSAPRFAPPATTCPLCARLVAPCTCVPFHCCVCLRSRLPPRIFLRTAPAWVCRFLRLRLISCHRVYRRSFCFTRHCLHRVACYHTGLLRCHVRFPPHCHVAVCVLHWISFLLRYGFLTMLRLLVQFRHCLCCLRSRSITFTATLFLFISRRYVSFVADLHYLHFTFLHALPLPGPHTTTLTHSRSCSHRCCILPFVAFPSLRSRVPTHSRAPAVHLLTDPHPRRVAFATLDLFITTLRCYVTRSFRLLLHFPSFHYHAYVPSRSLHLLRYVLVTLFGYVGRYHICYRIHFVTFLTAYPFHALRSPSFLSFHVHTALRSRVWLFITFVRLVTRLLRHVCSYHHVRFVAVYVCDRLPPRLPLPFVAISCVPFLRSLLRSTRVSRLRSSPRFTDFDRSLFTVHTFPHNLAFLRLRSRSSIYRIYHVTHSSLRSLPWVRCRISAAYLITDSTVIPLSRYCISRFLHFAFLLRYLYHVRCSLFLLLVLLPIFWCTTFTFADSIDFVVRLPFVCLRFAART